MQQRQVGKKGTIDRVDREIIRLLQKDGRISNTTIAKRIGISESTVRTRLNRLVKQQIIQIVAVSNPFKLGFEIAGNIKIHIDIKKADNVLKELKKLKELWYIALTTGSTDIDAEFNVNSRENLNALVFGKVNKIPGIIRTETSLIMQFVKREYDWGTALD